MSEKRGASIFLHIGGILAVLLAVQGVQIWAGWWEPSRFAAGCAWIALAMATGGEVAKRWVARL